MKVTLLSFVLVASVLAELTLVQNRAKNNLASKTHFFRPTVAGQEVPWLIVRAGDSFELTATCRSANTQQAGSVSATPVTTTNNELGAAVAWKTTSTPQGPNSFVFKVKVPARAPIALYRVSVNAPCANGQQTATLTVAVILNPWRKSSDVYLAAENLIQEYVLEESGEVWIGRGDACSGGAPRPWNFGQFNIQVLQVAFQLLDKTPLAHRNAALISRALSAGANSNDDNGILTGRWQQPYNCEGCQSPSFWTGSTLIIEKYLQTKKPVKYGQCWVFSGVLTSLCRALGIPARSVTNYNSAHENGQNGQYTSTINVFYDANLKATSGLNTGSVWNFHVWTDAWLKFAGSAAAPQWNAIDSTPQEVSDGIFQTGPAPLSEVKAKKGGKYDVAFVTSEVSAVVTNWVHIDHQNMPEDAERHPTEPYYQYSIDNDVGCQIRTKAVGGLDNIVADYKQGLTEKRDFHPIHGAKILFHNKAPISCELDQNDAKIGEASEFVVKCVNRGNATQKLKLTYDVDVIHYTGRVIKQILGGSKVLKLKRKAQETLSVLPALYFPYLNDDHVIHATVSVSGPQFYWMEQDIIDLETPRLNIRLPKSLINGEYAQFNITVHNPFKKSWTKPRMLCSTPGKRAYYKIKGEIVPQATTLITGKFKFLKTWDQQYTFDCSLTTKEVDDVTGSVKVPRSMIKKNRTVKQPKGPGFEEIENLTAQISK